MAVNKKNRRSYGMSEPLIDILPDPIKSQRAPTSKDSAEIGTQWIDIPNKNIYFLVSKDKGFNAWVSVRPTSYTTDDGNKVEPDAGGNLYVYGGTNINTVGNISAHSITMNLDDNLTVTNINADVFDTNVAAAGVTLEGTTLAADGTDDDIDINITPKGTGALSTVNIDATDIATEGLTVGTAAAGMTLSGTTLEADGTDVSIDINIIPQGNGVLSTTELSLTADLAVEHGGTGVSTLTDHGVLLGSGANPITTTAVGADNTVLVGNTGADPSFSDNVTVANINADVFDTNVAAAGVTLEGTTLAADGTDADIDINITPKGDGALNTTNIYATDIVADGLAVGTDAAGMAIENTSIVVDGTDTNIDITITPKGTGVLSTTDIVADSLEVGAAAAGVTLSGTTLEADGTDANIDINITPKGTGVLSTTELALTTDLAVEHGGTGVSTLTDHGILLGSGANPVTATAVGATGTVLVGNTGADPSFTADPSVTSLTATFVYGTTFYGTTFYTDVEAAALTLSGTTLAADGTDTNIDINITPQGDGVLNTTNIDATDIVADGLAVGTAAAGMAIENTSIVAGGTDANIDINITPKGTGVLSTTELALTTDLAVEHGGTGVGIFTQYAVLLGNGTAALSEVASLGTSGQVLTSNGAGVAPTWQAGGGGGSEFEDNVFRIIDETDNTKKLAFQVSGITTGTTRTITVPDSDLSLVSPTFTDITANSISLTTDLTVGDGGTGVSTLTDHGVLLGSGASAITATSAPTDGQLLVGSTGADPSLATLTEGTGIDVTNGSGSITIASTGTSINAQTGTTYTLVLADAGKLITLTNSSAITLTVPPNSSVAFPTGTQILIYQGGAGTVTVSPDTGVTINSSNTELAAAAQYSMCGLMKLGTDTWVFMGDKA